MKNRKEKYTIFISILLVVICDCMEEVIQPLSILFKYTKYGTASIVILICILFFLQNHSKKCLFRKEVKRFIIVLIYFAIVSIYKIYKSHFFTYKTVEELLQLIIPFVFAFVIVNFLQYKDILKLMKISLCVVGISYIVLNIPVFLHFFRNLVKISLQNSYSPFESSVFAEMAAGLAAFFIYYQKKAPFWTLLSILLVFLTFKRVFLLQSFLLILVCVLKIQDRKVSSWIMNISIIITIIGTLVFNYLIQKENDFLFQKIFGKSSGSFTMGRSYRIWYRLSGFKSFGYGSTSAVLGGNLELDLIKILMEIGIIGLILFIWCYFSLGEKNVYTYILSATMLLNLMFASGLVSTIGWIFRMIAFGVITYMPSEKMEDLCLHQKRKKISITIGDIRIHI